MPRNLVFGPGYTWEVKSRDFPTDSATENIPPFEISDLRFEISKGKGEKVG
jgi:hypothetical protein